jgi:hypothetical protein
LHFHPYVQTSVVPLRIQQKYQSGPCVHFLYTIFTLFIHDLYTIYTLFIHFLYTYKLFFKVYTRINSFRFRFIHV